MAAPPTTDPATHINNFTKLFGPIPPDYYSTDPTTHGDLTKLLINRAATMVPQQIVGLLSASYTSPLTHLVLPIRVLQPWESLNIRWNELEFNHGVAPRVETEGLARLYTYNQSEHGAILVRRGVAIKCEEGFYRTPEGQKIWTGQIQQLATIIQKTNEYDVMLALIRSAARSSSFDTLTTDMSYLNLYGKPTTSNYYEQLKNEALWFGIVNKSEDSTGLSNLCTNLRTSMMINGVEPDSLIVPPHMIGHYYYTKNDLREFSSAGQLAAENRKNGEDIGNPVTAIRAQTFQGMKLIDMYVGRHPNNTPVTPGDLLTVPKQIGEYYLMRTSDSIQDISDIKQFKSSMRNIRIFDEEQGRMVTIKYMDAVRNSFRFDNDGNLLTGNDPHGLFNKMDDDKNVSTDNTIISALDELEITRNREIPKFRWCDMTKENLTDESVKNVIQSIIIAMFKDPSEYMMTKDMYVDNKKNVTSFFNKLIKTCNGKKNLGENIKCLSTDIQARFDAFDVLLGTIWYNSEITFQNIESMHQMGIYIPLDFVIARPYMTYQVSSAIMLKSGKETGETIISRNAFQLTSNIADRTLYGNYFYYGRAIVKNPKNVTLAPHVFIQNYLFGNNTKFMNEDDLRTINNYGAIREGRRNNSLLSIMVRANANVGYENIIDIRGENPSLPNTQKEGAFFPGFNFIKSKLNINIPTSSPAEIPDYENTDFTPNTICWAGHYESHDGKIIQLNTGHLGPNTYNGVQMTRTPGYYTAMKNVFSATAGRV